MPWARKKTSSVVYVSLGGTCQWLTNLPGEMKTSVPGSTLLTNCTHMQYDGHAQLNFARKGRLLGNPRASVTCHTRELVSTKHIAIQTIFQGYACLLSAVLATDTPTLVCHHVDSFPGRRLITASRSLVRCTSESITVSSALNCPPRVRSWAPGPSRPSSSSSRTSSQHGERRDQPGVRHHVRHKVSYAWC
jgi:hypothetical protein